MKIGKNTGRMLGKGGGREGKIFKGDPKVKGGSDFVKRSNSYISEGSTEKDGSSPSDVRMVQT